MELRTRFLLFIVGISFFGLSLISVVAYNSVVEGNIRHEVSSLSELTRHLVTMMQGKKDLESLLKVSGMFEDSRYGLYIIDAEQNIYPPENKSLIFNRTTATRINELLESGQKSGYLENINADNQNTQPQIDITWYIADILGTDYSFALLREYSRDEEFNEFFDIFGVPLIVSGLVILWISAWGSLILASLFKKLDGQNCKLEKQTQDLEEARDHALLASKAKSQFLANMSHEIRTPLTAIIGFSETLLHHEQSKEDEEASIETIHRTGKHLLHLINEVLDLSKIEASKLEIESIRFSPLKLLLDLELVARPQAVDKNIKFDIYYDFPIPAVIKSDPFRLKQILYNLYSNAIKFTEHGYVGLRVSCDPDAQLMSFEMVDTGIGIKEESIERVFQEFSQADASVNRKYGGTGLGLTLSKKLAEMLGGTITVESKDGVGSRFLLTIDTGVLKNSEFVNDVEDFPKIGAKARLEVPRLMGRVLLAEDNEDNKRLITILIKKTGAEVVLASNGREAVEKALNDTIDLVLMDMQMPIMDGLDATRTLCENGFSKPIIALTANAMKEDRDRCYTAGCKGFLSKPIDRTNLYKVLSAHLVTIEGESVGQNPDIQKNEAIGANGSPIVSMLNGDPDFADLVGLFINNLHRVQAGIHHALKSEDWTELDNYFHQLKGSGGGIGFPMVSEVAGKVGKHLKDRAYGEIQSEIDRFDVICTRIYAGAASDKLDEAI